AAKLRRVTRGSGEVGERARGGERRRCRLQVAGLDLDLGDERERERKKPLSNRRSLCSSPSMPRTARCRLSSRLASASAHAARISAIERNSRSRVRGRSPPLPRPSAAPTHDPRGRRRSTTRRLSRSRAPLVIEPVGPRDGVAGNLVGLVGAVEVAEVLRQVDLRGADHVAKVRRTNRGSSAMGGSSGGDEPRGDRGPTAAPETPRMSSTNCSRGAAPSRQRGTLAERFHRDRRYGRSRARNQRKPSSTASMTAGGRLPTSSSKSDLFTVASWEAFATESFGNRVCRRRRSVLPGAAARRGLLVKIQTTTVSILLSFTSSR